MANLTFGRKKRLNELAGDIVAMFQFDNEVLPEIIATENNVQFYYDHYGKEGDGTGFEGLQIFDGENFHVHINLSFVWSKDSNRARYAFAHELGHFFIEEHHQELKNGYHPSKFDPKETNLIELEANYFAGALLMPELEFCEACRGKKFSLDLVEILSAKFAISNLAVILRFIEVGNCPLMIAYCKNGRLEWFSRSDDFPHKAFLTTVGKALPPTSVVGEYFRIGNQAKYTDVQTIYVDDWFHYYGDQKITLSEQCFYSDYGYVISLIWPD